MLERKKNERKSLCNKTKMNNRQKMRASNVKVRRWLEQNEYLDIHFFPHSRFIKDVHLSGQGFDGLASQETKLVLFQVKTNANIPKDIRPQYIEIAKKYSIRLIWFNVINRKPVKAEVFE